MDYDIGDVVVLEASLTVNDVPTNPDTIEFKVLKPDGSTDTITPNLVSTGNYDYDFVPNEAGTHFWLVLATGAAQAAEETSFIVKRPCVPR